MTNLNTISTITPAAPEKTAQGDLNLNDKEQSPMPKTIDVKAASTKELLDFYNANRPADANPVKRFATRAAAEKRVSALIDGKPAKTAKSPSRSKTRKEPAKNGGASTKAKKSAAPTKAASEKKRKSNSAGIKSSWTEKKVRAARVARHGCRVDGYEYPSVRAAYVAIYETEAGHIQFRKELKEKGKMTVDGMKWVVFEK